MNLYLLLICIGTTPCTQVTSPPGLGGGWSMTTNRKGCIAAAAKANEQAAQSKGNITKYICVEVKAAEVN